jgi:protoporphyrin/coproporphyrin ferrochelatase
MLNLGGPKTTADVEPFLVRMFSDRSFINIPFNLGPRIAKIRARRSVVNQYAKIGGSPLSKWTDLQGEKLVSLLDQLSPQTAPHKFYPCFRYSSPLISEVKTQLLADSPARIVAFTQYPHYSCATTGNSLRDVLDHLSLPNITAITKYATHPQYVAAWTELIRAQLAKFEDPNSTEIVFTAHSIPASVVWRGDAYAFEIGSTVNTIMQNFEGMKHHLFWQSKVGFQEWLKPNTRDGLLKLGEKGIKNVLLVPIAFMQEHLETLFELDLEYVREAKEKGMNVIRCPAPNDNSGFISAMACIVKEHLEQGKHGVVLRCVNCPIPELCKTLDKLDKKK